MKDAAFLEEAKKTGLDINPIGGADLQKMDTAQVSALNASALSEFSSAVRSVNGQPEVMNGPGDYLFTTTAQSTVTAILGCQNYDFLPVEQYDVWKDLVLNFNPNMFAETATQ